MKNFFDMGGVLIRWTVVVIACSALAISASMILGLASQGVLQ